MLLLTSACFVFADCSGGNVITDVYAFFFFLQTAMISDEKATEFKDKVYRAITIAYAIEYLLIALGSLLIIVAIVLVILSKKKGFEVSLIDT